MHTDRHLWEIRWIRDTTALLLACLLLYSIYVARAVTAPILIGLGLAYLVNPIITWAHHRLKVPRWCSTLTMMMLGMLVVIGLLVAVAPRLIYQATDLLSNLPHYLQQLSDKLGIDWASLTKTAERALSSTSQPSDHSIRDFADRVDVKALAESLARVLGAGIGWVGTAIGAMCYLGLVAVVIGFCFFFFSSHFDAIVAWFKPFVPRDAYDDVARIAGRMDQSVSAFVRGRLIQALVMGMILSVGWWIVGVPYWLLLGLGSGLLNLIPYAASVGWLAALLLAWIESLSTAAGAPGMGFNIGYVLVWPSVIYIAAQLIDGWVVEPIVQGKATDLDPLTVMLVVLIGGTLAGLVGVILAIPTAACAKIFSQEVILPKLRAYAAQRNTPHPPSN